MDSHPRPYARRFNPYGGFLDDRDGGKRKYARSQYLDDGGSPSEAGSLEWSRQIYPRFAIPGWAHLLTGVAVVLVGAVDVGWTAAKYEGSCTYTVTANFDPCSTNNVFTYISSPLWGGLLMLLNGIATFWMSPLRLSTNSWLLYIFVGLSVLLVFPVCPTIIVLNILEITENKGAFWNDVAGEGLKIATGNSTKFALPIVLIVLAFVDWIVATAAVVIGCCFPPDLSERLLYPGVERYLANVPTYLGPEAIRRGKTGDVVVSEEVIRPSGSRSGYGYAAQSRHGGGARSDYYDHYRPRSRAGDVVVSEEVIRPGGRSDRGFRSAYAISDRDHRSAYNVPPLGRHHAMSEDIYGGGGRRPRSRGGDVVVHEERIRPGDRNYPRGLY